MQSPSTKYLLIVFLRTHIRISAPTSNIDVTNLHRFHHAYHTFAIHMMAPLNVIAERHASSTSSTPSSRDENDKSSEIVVMVTPYSTGCCIAKEIKDRGYSLICLWNRGFAEEMKKHVPSSCADLSYCAEITEGETMEDTIAALEKAAASGGYKIVGVICGGEAGVDLGE